MQTRGILPLQDMHDFDVERRFPDAYNFQRNYNQRASIGNDVLLSSGASGLVTAPAAAASTIPAQTGTPKQLLSVAASESAFKNKPNQLYSLVSVSFTRDQSDQNFGFADVWVTGYHGTTIPTLLVSGTTSPISFFMETTGETVTITAVACSFAGHCASFTGAPTAPLTLNGVTTAPPAPSIAQFLVTSPVGYQFQFNILGGLLADVIDSYRVYRNTVNNPATASVVAIVSHTLINAGVYTFIDSAPRGTTFFYWVTSVNVGGLESVKTAAFSAAVTADSPISAANNLLLRNISSPTSVTVGPSTNSTVFAVIPEMTRTITTSGNKIFLGFTMSTFFSAIGANAQMAFFLDGVQLNQSHSFGDSAANTGKMQTMTWIDNPAAGGHTYDVRWRVNAVAATVVNEGTERELQVVEEG